MTFPATRSRGAQVLNYEFTSQTCFAAHASSRLFSGRNVDRENGGNWAHVNLDHKKIQVLPISILFLFIVSIEISIALKIQCTKLQSISNNCCNFSLWTHTRNIFTNIKSIRQGKPITAYAKCCLLGLTRLSTVIGKTNDRSLYRQPTTQRTFD